VVLSRRLPKAEQRTQLSQSFCLDPVQIRKKITVITTITIVTLILIILILNIMLLIIVTITVFNLKHS